MSKRIFIGPIFLRWQYIHNWPENIKELFYYWPRNFIIRGAYGWCPSDTSNIDSYLIDILPSMLQHFRDTTIARPCGTTEQQWEIDITTMINGFEAARKINDMDFFDAETGKINKDKLDELYAEYDLGMEEFSECFMSLWW